MNGWTNEKWIIYVRFSYLLDLLGGGGGGVAFFRIRSL